MPNNSFLRQTATTLYPNYVDPYYNDTNEAPTDLWLDNTTIYEGQPINTQIGNFTTTDPDTGNTFTYSLVPYSWYYGYDDTALPGVMRYSNNN